MVKFTKAEIVAIGAIQKSLAMLQERAKRELAAQDEILVGILERNKLPRNTTLLPKDIEKGIYEAQIPAPPAKKEEATDAKSAEIVQLPGAPTE